MHSFPLNTLLTALGLDNSCLTDSLTFTLVLSVGTQIDIIPQYLRLCKAHLSEKLQDVSD